MRSDGGPSWSAAALGLTRLRGYMLYKVSPRDPLSFGSAFLVLTSPLASASYLS